MLTVKLVKMRYIYIQMKRKNWVELWRGMEVRNGKKRTMIRNQARKIWAKMRITIVKNWIEKDNERKESGNGKDGNKKSGVVTKIKKGVIMKDIRKKLVKNKWGKNNTEAPCS